jgi:hypothetical protein
MADEFNHRPVDEAADADAEARMAPAPGPVAHPGGEVIVAHLAEGHTGQIAENLGPLAALKDVVEVGVVVGEDGPQRPARQPQRLVAGQLAVAGQQGVDVDHQRLFAPQRAVVVEDGQPLGRGHVARPAGIGHGVDERQQRVAEGAGAPGKHIHYELRMKSALHS